MSNTLTIEKIGFGGKAETLVLPKVDVAWTFVGGMIFLYNNPTAPVIVHGVRSVQSVPDNQ